MCIDYMFMSRNLHDFVQLHVYLHNNSTLYIIKQKIDSGLQSSTTNRDDHAEVR